MLLGICVNPAEEFEHCRDDLDPRNMYENKDKSWFHSSVFLAIDIQVKKL